MANPTLGSNKYWSVLAVPSLATNDFVITTSGAGFGILEMKTALKAKSNSLFFDTRNDGVYALFQVTHPHVDGTVFNSSRVESLHEIDIEFQNDETAGTTGESARSAITTADGDVYDIYIFENARVGTETAANTRPCAVHKYKGVPLSLSSVPTPGEKTRWHLKGKTNAQSDYEHNILQASFPAA